MTCELEDIALRMAAADTVGHGWQRTQKRGGSGVIALRIRGNRAACRETDEPRHVEVRATPGTRHPLRLCVEQAPLAVFSARGGEGHHGVKVIESAVRVAGIRRPAAGKHPEAGVDVDVAQMQPP